MLKEEERGGGVLHLTVPSFCIFLRVPSLVYGAAKTGSSVTGLEMVDGLAGGPHAEEVPGVALSRDCLCRGDLLALFC